MGLIVYRFQRIKEQYSPVEKDGRVVENVICFIRKQHDMVCPSALKVQAPMVSSGHEIQE